VEPFGISFELDGRTYQGTGKWDDDTGLEAEVRVQYEGIFPIPPTMPDTLVATINGSRRALLVRPYFMSYGGLELKVGSPGFSRCTLRAYAVMPDVPWDVEATAEVEYIRLASNALALWYGERGRPVEHTETGFRATFEWHTVAYDTAYGPLVTMQRIEGPRFPAFGKYHFNLYPLVTLVLPEPMSIHAAAERAIAMDGLFDLLASFPRRSVQVKVRLQGGNTFLEMRIALHRARDAVEDHPFNVFITREHGIGSGRHSHTT
jgi:hypothetical protein